MTGSADGTDGLLAASQNGRAGRLALVLADVDAPRRATRVSVDAAYAQLGPGDTLVWVSPEGLDADPPAGVTVRCCPVAPSAGRGELYGAGLTAACRLPGTSVVAFSDTSTVLGAGWRAALDAALADEATTVVGGPVHALAADATRGWEPGATRVMRDRVSWAGFLVEYAPHAVSPFRSASGDLSANNIAYRLETVRAWSGRPFWKTSVNGELRAAGHQPVVVEGMVAGSTRRYRFHDLAGGRWAAGRLYGSDVAQSWGTPRRLARTVASAALPAVLGTRLVRLARHDAMVSDALRYAGPFVAVALMAWSGGEAQGYLQPSSSPRGVR